MQTILLLQKRRIFQNFLDFNPTSGNDGDTKSICNIELQSLADQKNLSNISKMEKLLEILR